MQQARGHTSLRCSQLGGGGVVHVRCGICLPASEVARGAGQAADCSLEIGRCDAQAGAHLRQGRAAQQAGSERPPPTHCSCTGAVCHCRPAAATVAAAAAAVLLLLQVCTLERRLTMKSATAAMRRADTVRIWAKGGKRWPACRSATLVIPASASAATRKTSSLQGRQRKTGARTLDGQVSWEQEVVPSRRGEITWGQGLGVGAASHKARQGRRACGRDGSPPSSLLA